MSTVRITVLGTQGPRKLGRLTRLCKRILRYIGRSGWEVSILLCGDSYIQGLNARYRGKNHATDVLSFPQEDLPIQSTTEIAGDVVISMDRLAENAASLGVARAEELKRLLIHGILHLAGMDHERDTGEMAAEEDRVLRSVSGVRAF